MITEEQLINWLGTDDTYDKMVEVLLELTNDEYTIRELKRDVKEYNEQ